MLDPVRSSMVFKTGRKLPHNARLLVDLPQQQRACIAADRSSVKPG
jgi:hypothetical protein